MVTWWPNIQGCRITKLLDFYSGKETSGSNNAVIFYQGGSNIGFNSIVVVMMILHFVYLFIYLFIYLFLQPQTTDIKVGYKNCSRTFF